jgi:hypothetical protein
LPLFARAGASVPIATAINGLQRHDDPVNEILQFA